MNKSSKAYAREVMKGLSREELTTLEKWLDVSLPIETLYADFAQSELGSGAIGRDIVEAGKALLRNLHRSLTDVVCCSSVVKTCVIDKETNTSDMIALAAIIAALIKQSQAQVVNVTLVAALIVRVGIRKFCAKSWGT